MQRRALIFEAEDHGPRRPWQPEHELLLAVLQQLHRDLHAPGLSRERRLLRDTARSDLDGEMVRWICELIGVEYSVYVRHVLSVPPSTSSILPVRSR